MSNTITGNWWVLDTPGVTVLETGDRVIQAIAWVSNSVSAKDIADNDEFVLTDAASKAIISKKAEAVGQGLEVSFPHGLEVTGLILPTMGGGICYIYFGRAGR